MVCSQSCHIYPHTRSHFYTFRFALDRKIQLELEPPTPEVAEKENDGQEVKPDAEGVRNVSPQHTEDVPQIRSSVNERSPSGNFIADHIIIGRPGFNVRDECKPKGIKMYRIVGGK